MATHSGILAWRNNWNSLAHMHTHTHPSESKNSDPEQFIINWSFQFSKPGWFSGRYSNTQSLISLSIQCSFNNNIFIASLVAQTVECLSAMQETGFSLWVGRIPWNPLQYSCLDNPMNGGYSPWGHKELDTTERLHFHLLLYPGGVSGKELNCQCRRPKRCGFGSWIGKIPWRRTWLPTSLFLPREFHEQRSLGVWGP